MKGRQGDELYTTPLIISLEAIINIRVPSDSNICIDQLIVKDRECTGSKTKKVKRKDKTKTYTYT